jgi:hypothetical protein
MRVKTQVTNQSKTDVKKARMQAHDDKGADKKGGKKGANKKGRSRCVDDE